MIALRELERIERLLARASGLLHAAYPVSLQNWEGDAPDLETVRNLDTAFGQIRPWINHRRHNRRDPYLRSADEQARLSEDRR